MEERLGDNQSCEDEEENRKPPHCDRQIIQRKRMTPVAIPHWNKV
jgi:hypothetical protein